MKRIRATKKQIKAARAYYQSDDIEIDDDVLLSPGPENDGYWVSAWVWVNTEEEEEGV